ncbi:hypothetical protein BH23ACT3_BH23ACT3_05310 [soil metagenome]
MAYIEGRVVHDADAHIMEWPSWLTDYASAEWKERLAPREPTDGDGSRLDLDSIRSRHESDEYRADDVAEIMARKNFAATGSFIAEDRPRALDLLGVASQLVFNTFHNSRLVAWEHSDPEMAAAASRAHNRGMVDFCSVDERLLPTLYVPLAEFETAEAIASEAVEMGAAALLVPSACPKGHSPSHDRLDPVWAAAQDAGLPIVFHVGGGGEHFNRDYFANGRPVPPDFHGGEENFRSVDYMAIPHPVMQTLATMIFDGVFDRFPRLRFGVVEMGAIWLPSWIHQLEAAFDAFARHEERLRTLELRPAEYVQRQVRATPYPTEDVGWLTEQLGPEICLFSSDYPHVEGGRRPFERFEASLGDVSDAVRDRFYAGNFADLMGSHLPVVSS